MGEKWQYQLRIDLHDAIAETARRSPEDPEVAPLAAILKDHNATMKCQFDAFADYVAEAERQGADNYPLYAWTKATIENAAKKAKYLKSFSLYVEGKEVYASEKANALEAALRPLVGGPLVARMAKYDTNPANNPQPPPRYRK